MFVPEEPGRAHRRPYVRGGKEDAARGDFSDDRAGAAHPVRARLRSGQRKTGRLIPQAAGTNAQGGAEGPGPQGLLRVQRRRAAQEPEVALSTAMKKGRTPKVRP